MREHEAYEQAQRKANEILETCYVVTDRDEKSGEYDVLTAGSVGREHIIVGHCRPEAINALSPGAPPERIKIPVRQYVRPTGAVRLGHFEVPEDWSAERKRLAEKYAAHDDVYFEAEILTTGEVATYAQRNSLEHEERDWLIEICPNDESVREVFGKLLERVDEALRAEEAS